MSPARGEPFERSLPSPLQALTALRSSGEDSVVASRTITARQEAMYVPTGLDQRIADRMQRADAPSLLLLSGSAGGGKSALIRMLERAVAPGTFTAVVEDATHAEAPDEDQTRSLANVLDGFRQGVPAPGTRILLAANTGLLLRLERKFREAAELELAEVAAFALHQLGVPAARSIPDVRKEELSRSVLVVDLDQRPTSGAEDRLLRRMLAALDPDQDEGVLAGAARCRSCSVRAFCAPRTNLEILSDPIVGKVLDEAVEQVALRRGRDVPPRQLWDALGTLALGGMSVPAGADPCDGVAAIAANQDYESVWRAILPNGIFAGATGNTLCTEIAALDPAFQPGPETHDIIAEAGVDPESDAELLRSLLGSAEGGREAIATTAEALLVEREETDIAARSRGLVRAAWLVGKLPLMKQVPPVFVQAIGGEHAAIDEIVRVASQGIVRSFGRYAEGSYYLPTESLAETRKSRVLVRVELTGKLDVLLALPQVDNPGGSKIIGLRPLTARLQIGNAELEFDLSLYELLNEAAGGASAASIDVERFHSLRHAVEILGREIADDPGAPLLVVRDGGKEMYRAIIVPWRGRRELRISKVS